MGTIGKQSRASSRSRLALSSVKQRRRGAFDRELLLLAPVLRPYALSLTRDVTAADDLVQETFARALTYHDKFRAGTNLRAWLYTMMRNLFIADMRTLTSFRAVTDYLSETENPTTDSNQVAHLQLKQLFEKMELLPSSQRRAIHLVGLMGLTYPEAAKVEKCAVGTMKSRVSRARAFLDKEFQA